MTEIITHLNFNTSSPLKCYHFKTRLRKSNYFLRENNFVSYSFLQLGKWILFIDYQWNCYHRKPIDLFWILIFGRWDGWIWFVVPETPRFCLCLGLWCQQVCQYHPVGVADLPALTCVCMVGAGTYHIRKNHCYICLHQPHAWLLARRD